MIGDRAESLAKSETDQILDPESNPRSINQDAQTLEHNIKQKETTLHKQEEDLDQENEDGEEERLMTKSLSKTDSLRDFNAFFVGNQKRLRTDGDDIENEDWQRADQHSSLERQLHKL